MCCDLRDLLAQPIDETCPFSVTTVYNTQWKVLMQSSNEMIIHFKCIKYFKLFVTFNTLEHHLGKETL